MYQNKLCNWVIQLTSHSLDFGNLISKIRYLNRDLKFEGIYRLMQVIFYYDNPCLAPHLTVPKIPYYILFSVTCYLDS